MQYLIMFIAEGYAIPAISIVGAFSIIGYLKFQACCRMNPDQVHAQFELKRKMTRPPTRKRELRSFSSYTT